MSVWTIVNSYFKKRRVRYVVMHVYQEWYYVAKLIFWDTTYQIYSTTKSISSRQLAARCSMRDQ